MSLKVVKFDTKMYLNFSNFQGRTSAGGGQALVQKRGQVSDGGLTKFSPDGGPPSPQKKTLISIDVCDVIKQNESEVSQIQLSFS